MSGLARGIDGAAHLGVLTAGGHCHVVLGSGIDVVYPAAHRPLYSRILAGGGIISSEDAQAIREEAHKWAIASRAIAIKAKMPDPADIEDGVFAD